MDTNFISSMDEKQLDNLVRVIPTSAMIVNATGKILFSNKELADTLGYEGNLSGTDIELLLPEEYRTSHFSFIKSFFNAPTKRKMGGGKDLYALKKNGEKISIEIGLSPIISNGQTLVLATFFDTTLRFNPNQILADSISLAPFGILIASSDGIITYASNSLCTCFGYKVEELLGNAVEMLLPKRYRQHHQLLRGEYSDKPTVKMMGLGRDLTALHRDGKEFPVEIGLSPFTGNDNDMVLVSLTDITQRKRLENKLKEQNTNLEEFTYVASHDLRSPLNGIADLMEWIKEDLGADCNASVAKNIERVSIRIERMEQLIDNLLTYAKAGNISSSIQTVNLAETISNIIELIEVPDSFQINVELSESSFESALTPLETILRNLISNAIKHHDKENGIVNISCQADNSMLHFKVSDDGPGIPEASIDRIFRLFQTLTSSVRGSSGIGLSVCRRLAETHGGRISAENNSSGATFNLWWPRFIRKDTHD